MPQYPKKFASLLHIEELQMEVDIRHYDMEDSTLTPDGQFLVLKVWPTLFLSHWALIFPETDT